MTTARKRQGNTLFRRTLALLFTLCALGQNVLFLPLPTAAAADTATSKSFFYWHYVTNKNQLTREGNIFGGKRIMVVGQGACGAYMLNPTGPPSGSTWYFDSSSNVATKEWYPEYKAGTDFFTMGGMSSLHYSYSGYTRGEETWGFGLDNSHDKMDYTIVLRNEAFAAEKVKGGASLEAFRIDARDGGFRIWHYDTDAFSRDEDWYFKDAKLYISQSERDTFYLWTGTEYTARQIDSHASEIINGQTAVYGQPLAYVPPGMTLTVKNGGVLVVSGCLMNDGQIEIEDGGLLILKKNSAILPFTKAGKNCGGLTSSGNIIIQTNAKLIGGGVNGIQMNGGTVVNYGLMMSESFQVKRNHLVENKSSGRIIAGYGGAGLNFRNSILGDACSNNGKDTITSSVNVNSINSSNYSSYLRSYLSASEKKVYIADSGITGPGSVYKPGNNTAAPPSPDVVKVYTWSNDLPPKVLLLFSASTSAVAAKVEESLSVVFTVTDEGRKQEYSVPRSAESILTITVDRGYGEEPVYEGPSLMFSPGVMP